MLYMYNHITYASKCCSSQFNISNALLVEVCLLALLALYSILTVAGAQHQQPTVFGNRFHVFWAFFTAPSCPTPQQRLARRLLFRGDTLDRPWGDTSTARLTRRVPRARSPAHRSRSRMLHNSCAARRGPGGGDYDQA